MIFIMSVKMWEKNKKKLVLPKDYFLFDATEDDDARLSAYTNCITMDTFNPPTKLMKCKEKEIGLDDIIDIDKLEKYESNFFNGLAFSGAVMATVSGIINNPDYNIFIVMRNKSFKYYKKDVKKVFTKKFDVDFEFVKIFDSDIKSIKKDLNKDFKDKEIRELSAILKKREKEYEKAYAKKRKKK